MISSHQTFLACVPQGSESAAAFELTMGDLFHEAELVQQAEHELPVLDERAEADSLKLLTAPGAGDAQSNQPEFFDLPAEDALLAEEESASDADLQIAMDSELAAELAQHVNRSMAPFDGHADAIDPHDFSAADLSSEEVGGDGEDGWDDSSALADIIDEDAPGDNWDPSSAADLDSALAAALSEAPDSEDDSSSPLEVDLMAETPQPSTSGSRSGVPMHDAFDVVDDISEGFDTAESFWEQQLSASRRPVPLDDIIEDDDHADNLRNSNDDAVDLALAGMDDWDEWLDAEAQPADDDDAADETIDSSPWP